MADKVYPSGIIVKPPKANQEHFLLGKVSIKRKDFIKWLSDSEHLEDKGGFINLEFKRQMKDREKGYADVNMYGVEGSQKTVKANDHSPDRDANTPF